MRKYRFTENGFTFERVDKKTARRAYMNGATIVVCPCNLRPFTQWHPEQRINRKGHEHFAVDEIGVKNYFNGWIKSFEFYNCTTSETGKYAAFYIMEG